MLDNCRRVLRVQRVEDVEEVGAVNASPSRHVVGEKACELSVIRHLRPNGFQTELIVMWDIDPADLVHAKQLLALSKHILQEVLVQAAIRWQVELHCTGCEH